MKKFDLQRSLNNVESIITNTPGVTVKTISYFPNAKDGYRLYVMFGSIHLRDIDGKGCLYFDNGCPNYGAGQFALFMKPEIKEGWINIYDEYECSGKARVGRFIYDSEDAAKKASKSAGLDNLLATIKITWEE